MPKEVDHPARRRELDGLRVQLVTTPRQTTAEWALSVLDDFLAALAIPSAETAVPAAVDSRQG